MSGRPNILLLAGAEPDSAVRRVRCKGILGACFVTDPGNVLVLGFISAPFTGRTAVFAAVAFAASSAPPATPSATLP